MNSFCDLNAENAQNTSSFYDEFWKQYQISPSDEEQRRITAVQEILRDLSIPQNLCILDLGCGRGWMAPFLSQWGTVTGIDFSSIGIDFARQHYSDHGQFILADSEDAHLGLPQGTLFDLVISSEVIEHVIEQEAYLRQIEQFLKSEGWCILTTPNANLWEDYIHHYERAKMQPVENWLHPRDLDKLCHKVGFQVLQHRGIYIGRNARICKTRIFRAARRIANKFRIRPLSSWLSRSFALYQIILLRKRKTKE
jgi:2-polyprenyl-3-methyl-5-hydroxy-6-metoxy-1,4-benzoquinol methylase